MAIFGPRLLPEALNQHALRRLLEAGLGLRLSCNWGFMPSLEAAGDARARIPLSASLPIPHSCGPKGPGIRFTLHKYCSSIYFVSKITEASSQSTRMANCRDRGKEWTVNVPVSRNRQTRKFECERQIRFAGILTQILDSYKSKAEMPSLRKCLLVDEFLIVL
jgi:hypothetical protein